MTLPTPYYLIHEKKLLRNLRIIKHIRDVSGAKSLLALKCFSTWSVFDLMREYLDGTTSSSLFEARLGHEKFGKETHAYCVAWTPAEIRLVKQYAETIIFNSASQLKRYYGDVKGKNIGVRINPGVSYSHFDAADPARRYCRLGVTDDAELHELLPVLRGAMFHFNCENDDVDNFAGNLDLIGVRYGAILSGLEWISLGGGLLFTNNKYPLEKFCRVLKDFARRFSLQVYLEPGEAAVTRSTELVTTVTDIVHNEADIAIVNASIEAHMLDLLIYGLSAKIEQPRDGRRIGHVYTIAGRSCLAGDIFGTFTFPRRLRVGSPVRIADAGGYTMVKKNWFNGLSMPSIAVKRLDGSVEPVRSFVYNDFLNHLS
jgi:carboxynorspermidine decarboxylase